MDHVKITYNNESYDGPDVMPFTHTLMLAHWFDLYKGFLIKFVCIPEVKQRQNNNNNFLKSYTTVFFVGEDVCEECHIWSTTGSL